MISSISQFTAGSKDDESFSTDASGHLTTSTIAQTTVSMSKSPQPLTESLNGNTFNQNVPQLTLSFSDGSSNDHHLAFCLFEVCLGLREFTIQKGNLPVKERRKNPNVPISLSDYHNWFLSGFTIWINVAAKQVHIFSFIHNISKRLKYNTSFFYLFSKSTIIYQIGSKACEKVCGN